MTRVLVTGASGLLGGRLADLLSREFTVTAGVHLAAPPAGLDRVPLDLRSPGALARSLDTARPDAVVHAAALADADRCEAAPADAEELNVVATGLLAEECARRGLRLVVISTDLVFSGEEGARREDDPALPILRYGETKLRGEEQALRRCAGSAVVRVALVSGRGHGSRPTASEAVAWSLRAGRPVRLFTDQYRTPVDAGSAAAALARLLRGTAAGRYHMGGPERVSRHGLGLRVADVLGLPRSGIEAVTQAEVPLGVRRPADVSLDSDRARRELGFAPQPLEQAICEGRPVSPAL